MGKAEVMGETQPAVANMPRAVTADASALSAQAKGAIQALTGNRPLRFTLELFFAWLFIAATIGIGVWADKLWVTALCVFLVSTRQGVLALLLHDQVHRLGWRNKYGDWLANVFIAYPLFVTTIEDYANVHLTHHKHFFTQQDPDFLRKAGAEWTYPKSLCSFLIIVLKDITALNLVKLVRGKSGGKITDFSRRNPTPLWLRIGFFATVAGVLTVAGGWKIFLIYWVLPAATFSQLIVRWIAICEHQYNVEHASVHDVTPLIQLPWWQRLLVPDLNFGYHVYHHMHPGVAFANLPEVHRVYAREGLVDERAIFKGQGAYLKYLLSKSPAPSVAAESIA